MILHGSWILQSQSKYFFLWAETWKPLATLTTSEDYLHPYCLNHSELISFLAELGIQLGDSEADSTNLTLYLPTHQSQKDQPKLPLLAGQRSDEDLVIKAWQVQGITLTATETVKLLSQLPLTDFSGPHRLGGELKFWTHIYRWSLDLITRQKFLPGVTLQAEGQAKSYWQILLDSNIDNQRLAQWSEAMPPACFAYEENLAQFSATRTQNLILSFLVNLVEAQLRDWLDSSLITTKNTTLTPWLQSLIQTRGEFAWDTQSINRLANALDNWTLAVGENLVDVDNTRRLQRQYRLCLILQPPEIESHQPQADWHLKFALAAIDDPDFIVSAAEIWQHPVAQRQIGKRIIAWPQETLLKGLGLAARIYQPIAASLETAQPVDSTLDPIQVYEFIRVAARQLQNNGFGVIFPPGLGVDSDTRLGVKIVAGVKQKKNQRLSLNSLLDYKLQIAVGSRTIDKSDFEQLLAQKSPIVEVDGQWLALQPADVRTAQTILQGSSNQTELSVEDALRLATGDTKTLDKLPVVHFEATGILQELITNLTENKSVEPIQPKQFRGELRPYQARGVGWLAFLDRWGLGACLADDMGLGKTAQLIAFLLHLKQEDLSNSTLVVCPTSVLSNWEREIHKFAPSLSTLVHHGDRRQKGKKFATTAQNKDVVITSYALAYRDLKTLQGVDWEIVVLDEAQNIKNAQSKQSQAIRTIQSRERIALTGTPVENRLSDLWSIMDFLNPNFLGTKAFFQKRFATPIEKYGDSQSLNILRSLVNPFILRRLKTDPEIVTDLPEKQEMSVFCGLSEEQAQLYQRLVDHSLEQIDSAEGIKRKGLILTLLLRLKQLCNHPALLDKTKKIAPSEEFGDRSGKLLRLQDMLEEIVAEGDRALIFTQFSEWGKLLQPYLEQQLQQETLFLYGATRRQQRQEMIDRFQNDPNGPPIFILSLKAGGTGLNLTRANHVFHVDRWWNPAVENQATDRAFRIGQKRNVQVHKFVCSGTLEERINDIIESKQELAQATVDAGEDWLTDLDTDQLRNLLLLDRDAVIDQEDL